MKILESLNKEQKEAVLDTEGPVLVLAGAGSGKTRVLTHKVAYLVSQGKAKPWEILAVTFTNKAAGEMRERIESLIGAKLDQMWVGTFHSLFSRIVRRYADRIGYKTNFAIYDREDQERVMKEVLKNCPGVNAVKGYKTAVRKISDLKGKLLAPTAVPWRLDFGVDLPTLHAAYNSKMKAYNALDFDDLLLLPFELMKNYQDILNIYRERFRYILVDEFQDTNIVQNEILKLLWSTHRNITVVGDDDQAIYGWRGAELENILRFENDYPGSKTYRLERNYRSTDRILRAAQSVIDNNLSRHQKTLWTDKKSEQKPLVIKAFNSNEEASLIVRMISEAVQNGTKASDIAILYRINSQSRSFEGALREYNIPYTIVGGLKFYQRKEIKDILAYLKLVVNPEDGISLLRIINFPPRGIGATTIDRLNTFSLKHKTSIRDAINRMNEITEIKAAASKKLVDFIAVINIIQKAATEKSFPELVDLILTKSGMIDHYLQDGSEEAFGRIDNLKEFKTGVQEYVRNNPERTIDDFLQEVALVTDIDEWEKGDLVSLMTIHSAKGLEFPSVFIVGMEDGIFPLIRNESCDLEEERRLFYVGATRAKDQLYISCSSIARNGMYANPSRFLDEIDPELLDFNEGGSTKSSRKYHSVRQVPYDEAPDIFDVKVSSVNDNSGVSSFRRGDLVIHNKFGEGMVSATEGSGENEKVMVYFQGYGAKKLMVKFAGLRKINP